ncbi:tripartite tricarboxylate transporter substrate binding protein [uncultured Oscillibacter sp.]|uniref:tripartite tricarboxylate transporter substrate binding protein n=1 Tax=uncultured Oscillibacter sp. TaxID=876091 RepID=UPI0025DA1E47|nr:tripartite tricarboxylate transporter substrate binding protein [uncultured Oscillibacter sp.]
MKKKILALLLAAAMALSLAACSSGGSDAPSNTPSDTPPKSDAPAYPTKGISVICPWGAGGGTDSCLRAFSEAIGKQLGQTLTVDNRTGGGGIIGHQAIADADPDGYTIGMVTFELSTYKPLGSSELTYEDYDLLCRVNRDPATVTVNAEWAAANNITDLKSYVEYCLAHPGEVQMGGSSNASVWHIAGGYLMQETGIDIQMITYQEGAATAVQNAASGFIQGVTVSLAEARSFIESGHLICLGLMDTQRSDLFPDVPTCQEQGYDVLYYVWRGMGVPKGMDADVLSTVREACAAAIEDPDFVEYMKNAGLGIAYLNADDFGDFLKQNAEDVAASMEILGF